MSAAVQPTGPADARRKRRVRAALSALLLLLIAAAAMIWGHLFRGWFMAKRTLGEHIAFLAPAFEFERPEPQAGSRVGAVVLMPGCLGTRSHLREWAAFFRAKGWATLIVDSFGPRGIDQPAEFEAMCEGARPWGFERGADVAAAVTFLRGHDGIDPDRILLLGESSGAWAVMDSLTFGPSSAPLILDETPLAWRASIRGAVLLYPYCGFGSRSASRGWSVPVPAVMLVPDQDVNIEPEACVATADRLIAAGADLKLIRLAGATHWFDNRADFAVLPHRHDPTATALARREAAILLAQASAHPRMKGG